MKVECVGLSDPATGKPVRKSASLTVGKVYQVLCVFMEEKGPVKYRLIRDDGHTAALYESSHFKVVSGVLPSNWVAHYQADAFFELAPKTWVKRGFWENYFDGDSTAIKQFNEEKEIIEQSGC